MFNFNSKAKYFDYAPQGKVRLLAISAHQDDIEIMATDGILQAFDDKSTSFSACVVTDGAGSARSGIYANYTDEEMKSLREKEQQKAAFIGNYSSLTLLNFTSAEVKQANNEAVINDLIEVIRLQKPDVIYTHNLCDKHPTHLGVASKVIQAIRRLPLSERPQKVYGCEVWRDLDWLDDKDKVLFNVSKHESLQAALLGVFDSQIAGGKRYDLATNGRRYANATYSASHSIDKVSSVAYAMDLSPLIQDDTLDIVEYAISFINKFAKIQKEALSQNF